MTKLQKAIEILASIQGLEEQLYELEEYRRMRQQMIDYLGVKTCPVYSPMTDEVEYISPEEMSLNVLLHEFKRKVQDNTKNYHRAAMLV